MSTHTTENPGWDRLESLVEEIFGDPPPRSEPPVRPPSVDELLGDLTSSIDALDTPTSLLAWTEARQAAQDTARREADAEAEEVEMKRLHSEMRRDIATLHSTLGTGIDDAEMLRLSEFIVRCDRSFEERLKSGGMTSLVTTSIMRRILSETGHLAWDSLRDLMQKSTLGWPDPSGMDHVGSTEGEGVVRDHDLATEEEELVQGDLLASPGLIIGLVPVWRAAYPESQGALWKRTVLQAVGSGMRARFLEKATLLLEARKADLEAQITVILRDAIKHIHDASVDGVDSIADALQLTAEATQICQETVPDLIWRSIASEVSEGDACSGASPSK